MYPQGWRKADIGVRQVFLTCGEMLITASSSCAWTLVYTVGRASLYVVRHHCRTQMLDVLLGAGCALSVPS